MLTTLFLSVVDKNALRHLLMELMSSCFNLVFRYTKKIVLLLSVSTIYAKDSVVTTRMMYDKEIHEGRMRIIQDYIRKSKTCSRCRHYKMGCPTSKTMNWLDLALIP